MIAGRKSNPTNTNCRAYKQGSVLREYSGMEDPPENKKKVTVRRRAEFRSKTREEINKMRVPGVPYLPPPPDRNMFKRGNKDKQNFSLLDICSEY